MSAYSEGYDAALKSDQPECPYPEGDPRHDEWWDGFGDGTEDFIAYNRGDY